MTQPPGGYRPPANPAAVSGPGALSQRTDGRQPMRDLPDAAYGEQATFRQDQQGAPMAQAAGAAQGGPPVAPADLSNVTPLHAPTERPGEPVTAGADAGAGPGAAVLGLDEDNDPAWRNLVDILPTLELMANSAAGGHEMRQFVRRVRSRM